MDPLISKERRLELITGIWQVADKLNWDADLSYPEHALQKYITVLIDPIYKEDKPVFSERKTYTVMIEVLCCNVSEHRSDEEEYFNYVFLSINGNIVARNWSVEKGDKDPDPLKKLAYKVMKIALRRKREDLDRDANNILKVFKNDYGKTE